MQRYAALWKKFKSDSFNHEDATVVLNDKMVSIALSELRKSGWLTVALSEEDARKRVYTLKSPEDAIASMGGSE